MRNNLNTALATLGAVVGNKDFRRWEVEDQKDRMYMDIALSQAHPNSVVMEELHKSAFRKGLCNSIYSPSFNIPKWNYIDVWMVICIVVTLFYMCILYVHFTYS